MRRAVSSARKALMTGFVPQHLGFGHIFRDEVTASQHTRTLTQDMFSSGSTGKKNSRTFTGLTFTYKSQTTLAFPDDPTVSTSASL